MSQELVLVTSCTARKRDTPHGQRRTAETLYTGQQHVRLMRGVRAYRDAGQPAGEMRFRILSAAYGLLSPSREVASYNQTFAGLSVEQIRREAGEINVPADMRRMLAKPFGAGLLLLGDPYLRACDLDEHVKLGGPLLLFCSPAVARRMPAISGLRTVTLANAEAKRFSCGLTALKGELGSRLLSRLARDPREISNVTSSSSDVLSWLESARPLSWSTQAAA